MPTVSRDPRSYVRQVPLPVSTPHGVKVQARTVNVYNPMVPTREVIRRVNYKRRLSQMTSQGFRSVNYKPYQGIGDPFYLDQKKLILHALGQLDQSAEVDSGSSSDEDDRADIGQGQMAHKRSEIARKFVLRRAKKGLNTLNKEVTQGRTLVRNVKLGHGLFDLIKQQRHAKRESADKERCKKEEAARREWQPPKRDSSSDESVLSDDELGQDVDLRSFMSETDRLDTDEEGFDQSVITEAESPEGKGGVKFSGLDVPPSTVGESRPISRKKKPIPLRPYTPQHNNLGESTELVTCSKQPLFRQLCALHWILEAMNIDHPSLMGPISLSWSLTDIGGVKTTSKKILREKLAETTWNQFLSKDQLPKGNKRSTAGIRAKTTPRRQNTRNSVISLSSSQMNVAALSSPGSLRVDSTIPEDSPTPSSATQEAQHSTSHDGHDEPAVYKSGIFKFLDEYYASMGHDNTQPDTQDNLSVPAETDTSSVPPADKRSKDKRADLRARTSRTGRKSARGSTRHLVSRSQDDRLLSGMDSEKVSSRSTRSSVHLQRPKSSPQLLEFQASLPSNKLSTLPMDLRQKFADIKGDKELELHDTLEQIDRNRFKICQNKFVAMSAQGHSFHRAVEEMRARSRSNKPIQQNLRKRSSIHCSWYAVLTDNLPAKIKEEWYFAKILQKLSKYGLVQFDSSLESRLDDDGVEGSGKQSVYKFLNVLKGLRTWEICTPDVSAAVEYCRSNIVEMTVDEYEEWFAQTFPSVNRPQTAPPTLKGNQKGGNPKSASSKQSAKRDR